MIKYKDGFNIERGIEFSASFCGKYINLTNYVKDRGGTIQIPRGKLQELIENLTKLREDV